MTLFSDVKDKYIGRDVFIVASGPSVSEADLSIIRDKPVLLVNGALSLLRKHKFGDHAFVTTDKRFLGSEVYKSAIKDKRYKNSLRILRYEINPFDDLSLRENSLYVKTIGRDGFSQDLEEGFYFGCTSLMLALQSAYYMGAARVFMIGADFSYIFGGKRFYKESVPQPVDHFFSVQVWNVQNAYQHYVENGRSLYVSGRESLLRPYVPYMPIEEAHE